MFLSVKRKIFEYDDFFPMRRVRFGDSLLNGPNRPEVILRTLYGDYMRFPSDVMAHRHANWENKVLDTCRRISRTSEQILLRRAEASRGPRLGARLHGRLPFR